MEKPPDRNRAFARRSRGAMTDTETELWRLLRDRRLHGIKFRRQVPIGPYVYDLAEGRLYGFALRQRDDSENPNLVFEAIREHIQRAALTPLIRLATRASFSLRGRRTVVV